MSARARRRRGVLLGGIGLALIGLVVAVTLSVSQSGGGASVAPEAKRSAAPDVTFALEDGERRSLASFRGRPVVLGFVLPYCATCIETLHRGRASRTSGRGGRNAARKAAAS